MLDYWYGLIQAVLQKMQILHMIIFLYHSSIKVEGTLNLNVLVAIKFIFISFLVAKVKHTHLKYVYEN